MPSFSNTVKKEISACVTDKDRRYACLYGTLLFCRGLSEDRLSFTTESREFSELFAKLVRSVFGTKVNVLTEKSERRDGLMVYSEDIPSKEETALLLEEYSINCGKREINLRNIVNNSLSSFLAGVFLICGSVSDPNKEYHLEFTPPSDLLCGDLLALLASIGIDGKKTVRKGMPVLYIKDSESIEDVLTFIGAQQSTIELINIKIYKDVRNKANRLANCDTANIDKVIRASVKQTEDIRLIISKNMFEKLPADLREAAQIRLENPEMTLQEIGQQLSKPIGRSGVARRFQKISQAARKISGEKNDG